MKVLVVLVLVVFTGCNADLMHSDRPKPKLEVMFDFLVDYVLINFKAGEKIVNNFWRTEFAKTLREPLQEAAHAGAKIIDNVMHSIPPTAKAIMKTSAEASYKLTTHGIEYVVKNHLEPMAESAAPVIEEAVGDLLVSSQAVQDVVSPYVTELMEKVQPFFQNAQARLQALHQSVSKTQ